MEGPGSTGTLARQSEVPSARTFQVDPAGLGGIAESVNLFRGDVTLPLRLVSVTSRSGLEAWATLLYQGPSADEVDRWNLDTPTGLCGVGWKTGFDFIALDDKATGAPNDDDYYLVTEGRPRRLFKTASASGYEEYELEEYEFWTIRHYPADERWLIVKEDGNRYTYGGRAPDPASSPVQYGVKWGGPRGNWRGSSVQTSGQSRFPIAWNLAEIRNPWGDVIRFGYDNDLEVIGTSAGLTCTRASRLASVTAPYGRTLTYHYAEKVHNESVHEYQIPHHDPQTPGLHAFQDRWDPHYLDSIEVRNAPDAASGSGELVLTVRFGYELVNASARYGNDPDFCKRYLTKIVMTTGDGLALPGYAFDYYNEPSTGAAGTERRGALKSVVHPQGGRATYGYTKTALARTSRTLEITPAGTPRVWFGPDYTVITVLDGDHSGLDVSVYSWTGEWIAARQTYTLPDKVDLETLRVSAEGEFFALSFVSQGAAPKLHLALFRKEYGRRGNWFMDRTPTVLDIDEGDQGLVSTGQEFVIAVASGGHGCLRVWDPVSKSWLDRRLPALDRAASYALAATHDYFALASFHPATRRVTLTLQYLDNADRQFRPIHLQVNALNDVLWDEANTPADFWGTGADYAVMTYATRKDDTSLDYKITIQQWGADFTAKVGLDTSYSVATADDLPFLRSVASGAVVGNVGHLFRFNGVRWAEGELPLPAPGAEPRHFAYGSDLAVVSGPHGAAMAAFDPFADQWSVVRRTTTGGTGVVPTINGDYVSMDRSVQYRNAAGEFTEVCTLPSPMVTGSLANRAPQFLAYQDAERGTHVLPIANGRVLPASATRLPNEQIATDGTGQPGTHLIGPSSFVTFTGSGFDRPSKLTLHHYLDGKVTGPVERYPVATLRFEDGAAQPWGSGTRSATGIQYAYDGDNVSLSPDGTGTEFAAATAVYGVAATPASVRYPAAETTPFGRSEYRFHNDRSPRAMGLVPDDALLESAGVYYSYLNGMLYDQTDYDADGEVVERVMNLYEVVTEVEPLDGGGSRPLVGGYVRPVAVETSLYEKVIEVPAGADGPLDTVPADLVAAFAGHDVDVADGRLVAAAPGRWRLYPDPERLTYLPVTRDGDRLTASAAVTRTVSYQHSRATGLLVSDSTSSHDAQGRLATFRREIYYGWQIPAYRALAEAHVWSPVVLSLRFHQLDGSSPGDPVECSLTTLRAWPGCGEGDVALAPGRTYAALSPAVYDPTRTVPVRFDDWDNAEPDVDQWRRIGEVVARTRHGAVREATDVQGRPSCNVLDVTGTQRLAEFTNAGLGEVSYLGFEQYESDDGWSLSDGSPLVSHVVEGDAHTGFRSLRLPPGPASLRRSLSLRGDGTVYILSYWVKTPAGFSGGAAWRVEGPRGTLGTFPVEGTGDQWAHRHHVVRCDAEPGGAVDVTLSLTNAGSDAVLLDTMVFTPLTATAEATVFHPRFGDPTATVTPDGGTDRVIYDSYRRAVGSVGPHAMVTSALALYLVRQRDPRLPFAFPADAPNAIVEVRPQNGGVLADLTQGAAWTREWSGADPARWAAREGRLVHTAAGEDTLTFLPSDGLEDYGVRVSLHLPRSGDGTPVQPAQPLGLAIGDAVRVVWEPARGWTVTVGEDTVVPGDPSGAGIATDWLLLAPKDPVSGRTAVLFYADGEQVFARLDTPAVRGPVRLRAGDANLAFSDIATLVGPQITVSYLDGAAREIQHQGFDGEATVVAATLYDPVGRAAVGTKEARLPGLPGYRSDLVRTFDPATGVMTGEVTDAYPADEGYPYLRTDFRRTAQSLVSTQGVPGRAFAIRGSGDLGNDNPHVRHIDHGTNQSGEFGDAWPSHQYFVTRISDPNGDRSYTVTTKTGEQVGVARGPAADGRLRTAWFDYDGAGRLTRVLPPAGVEALRRGDSDGDAWATVNEYSYAGHLIARTTPDTGTTRYVHDRSGAVRFSLTAEGTGTDGADDTIAYTKYDPLGRVTEEGFFTGRWDQQALEDLAGTSPDWPDATQPHTVTLRNSYDGDGADPTLFGRLARTETWLPDGSPATVERLAYDIDGNLIAKSLTAYGFDAEERVISYTYDAAGNLTGIGYPPGSAEPRIVRGYDRLGRLHQVGTPEDPGAYGRFSYGARGELISSDTPLGAERVLRRTSTYTPPGWPLSTRHELDDGSLLLEQHLSYTEDGYRGAGYFDGKAAGVRTTDAAQDQTWRYRYDGLSQITDAENAGCPEAGLEHVTYGPNGNVTALTRGQREETYAYRPASDRLDAVISGGQRLDGYAYHRGGAVTGAERLGIDRIAYHPVTGLPQRLELAARPPERTGNQRVELVYDSDRQRAVKLHEDAAGTALTARLYVRGSDAASLFEAVRTPSGTKAQQYVYGPEGLTALLSGAKRYTVVRDHLGSPRQVVDETGAVVAAYDYTPFGATITRPGSAQPDVLVYRYTGQEWDPETGLYNYRARLYDPVLGRYYAADPAARGSSPYVYVENNPVNLIDPDGEEPLTAFLIIVIAGAVIGAVAGAVTYATTHQGNFNAGAFFAYAAVGTVAGAVGGAIGYGAGLLATEVLAAASVSTSTSIGSGIFVGAATGAVDGAISGSLNQVGVNLIEHRPIGEGVGLAAGMGAGIGAAVGGLAGGVTGAANWKAARLAESRGHDVLATSTQKYYGGSAQPYWNSIPAGAQPRKWLRNAPGALTNRLTTGHVGPRSVLTINAHGNPANRTLGFIGFQMRAANIANALQGERMVGINATICWAGSNGVARTWANQLNVPVRAASGRVWAWSYPATTVDRFGGFRTYYPSKLLTGWIALFGY
ncbi:RHS repeat-associated core domain-containing protein [Streptomyces hygroscopicus]|uniref:RHS repeat-associated core domain-containing protein n=1 Tax=Streptomyces hygroscopicus TaxID=1912 RepID=UPI00367CDC33